MKIPINQNQEGIVSITVTVVFIMVISLTVLGFSQVSRRDSQASQDRQLSSQAYYAAESAINDAVNKVAKAVETGQAIPEQASCSDSTKYTQNNGDLQMGGVRYTCLKVKAKLNDLQYSNVSQAVTVPLNAAAGTIGANDITWSRVKSVPAGASLDKCPVRNSLPSASVWASKCPFGLLRVDIVPMTPGAGGTIGNPDNAVTQTMTVFLYPKRSNAAASIQYENSSFTNSFGNHVTQGAVINASCDDDTCKATVTGLDFSSAFMRVQSLYNSAPNLQVAAQADTQLVGAQVEIAATGKAQDVLRAIKVRYPLVGSSRQDVPDFATNALQSTGSICKYFTAYPGHLAVQDPRCN